MTDPDSPDPDPSPEPPRVDTDPDALFTLLESASGSDGDGSGRPRSARAAAAAASRRLRTVGATVADRDAAGFVHVGTRADPDLRALTALDAPTDLAPDTLAVVVTDRDRAVLLVPEGARPTAAGRFPGGAIRTVTEPPGAAAASLLTGAGSAGDGDGDGDADGDGDGEGPSERTVLVPAHLPHDAAVYLERAGFTVTSTAAVRRARVEKTDGELAAMRRVQRAGDDALARVRAVLRTASVSTDTGTNGDGGADGGALTWRETPVTAERLRRVANVSVAAAGVDPAGATTVRVGGVGVGPGTDPARVDPDRAARAGDPIVVDLAPRGPAGYRGGVARTAVVGGRGGWERRAHVAVEAARRAALSTVEPGVTAATVRRELAAELTAYGFQAESRATVHGVGLSPRERPRAGAGMGEELRAGTTLAIAASVADPPSGPANDRNDGDHDRTGEGPLVRLRDVVAVTSDGAELLVDPPTGLSP